MITALTSIVFSVALSTLDCSDGLSYKEFRALTPRHLELTVPPDKRRVLAYLDRTDRPLVVVSQSLSSDTLPIVQFDDECPPTLVDLPRISRTMQRDWISLSSDIKGAR